MNLPLRIWLLLLAFALASPASALVIDFEGGSHGSITHLWLASPTSYDIVAVNPNRPFDFAVVFDTNETGTSDGDLERGTGWSVGNLAPGTDLGNVLILQENDLGCASGLCSDPDDEGRRPAGTLAFRPSDLVQPILGAAGRHGESAIFQHFAFDLIDVESAAMENGSITFHRGLDDVVTYSFASFLDLGQGVIYGNNSANRIILNDIGDFDAFTISLGGSGAIDNLRLSNARIVPEPSTALLLGLGLLGLAIPRRAL